MNLDFKKKKDIIYEAQIIFDGSSKNIYYSEKFLNYDDAIDKCNTEYYKLKDKTNYKKNIELIK